MRSARITPPLPSPRPEGEGTRIGRLIWGVPSAAHRALVIASSVRCCENAPGVGCYRSRSGPAVPPCLCASVSSVFPTPARQKQQQSEIRAADFEVQLAQLDLKLVDEFVQLVLLQRVGLGAKYFALQAIEGL